MRMDAIPGSGLPRPQQTEARPIASIGLALQAGHPSEPER
jgi:hypothetical protein